MSPANFAVPAEDRYFEDYLPGAVIECGRIPVSEAEIIEFARRYDPQDMHVDPEAAARGRFGGLVASGWHTAAMTMRLVADDFLPKGASLASPGIDELRWLKPVRPGDVLRIRVTVVEATPSRSRPDRGMVRSLVETLNQDGDVVMSMKPMNIIRCRSPHPSPPPQAGEGTGGGS
jgi:acyl dehydratase